MDATEMKDDELVNDWLNGIEAAANTRRNYLTSMKKYSDFTRMSPDAMIIEAEAEVLAGTLMRMRSIKRHLLGFREILKDGGLAPKTVHGYMAAIKSFYASCDIDLPNLNQKKQAKVKPLRENDLRLEKNDIIEALKHAGVRNRALILVMCSSGLAQSDVLALKVKDFRNGFDPETGICILHVRRIKTDYDFITFLSPEASRAVTDWLGSREIKPRKGKGSRDRFEKHRVRSDDDYLFTKNDVPVTYLKDLDEEMRKLTPDGLMDSMRRIAVKCGKETEKGCWGQIRAHQFRKFFNSALLNGGADIFTVEYLMGHTIDETKAAYFKADPERLKDRYMKYLPYLSIEDTEVKVVESVEYTELKRELDDLKAKEKARAQTEEVRSGALAKIMSMGAKERADLLELMNELQPIECKK
jgi:integrase